MKAHVAGGGGGEWCPGGAFAEGENEASESTEASSGLQRQQSQLRRLRLRRVATIKFAGGIRNAISIFALLPWSGRIARFD